MQKKFDYILNLWDTKVDFVDNQNLSPNYFNFVEFPEIFKAGKNLIRIKSNPNNMVIGTKLRIEIIDSNDEPIYYEILERLEPDKTRSIIVYIYPNTSEGIGKFTILGTAYRDNTGKKLSINSHNVKYNKRINIQVNQINDSEIIYQNLPSVKNEERIIPYFETKYSGSENLTSSMGQISYLDGVIKSDGFEFTNEMLGGEVYVENPTDLYPNSDYYTSSEFNTSIIEIYDNKTAKVNKFIQTGSLTFQKHEYKRFGNSNYELSYKASSSKQETEYLKSYIYSEFNNLDPSSGQVSKIKTYFKSLGETKNQWELIDEILLENQNLLVLSSSNNVRESYGDIKNQSVIDNYYTSSNLIGTASLNLSYNSSSLFNSIETNYSNYDPNNDEYYIEANQEFYLYKDNYYKLSLKSYGSPVSNENEFLKIYLSGSSVQNIDYIDSNNIKKAKYIGEFNKTNNLRLHSGSFIFKAIESGYSKLLFKPKGKWYISNISLNSKYDYGFTPNHYINIIPTPERYRYDKIDIKYEFINNYGDISKSYLISNDLFVTGSNNYLRGDDTLISGSGYLGEGLNSGLELLGKSGGGYIRSYGYDNYSQSGEGVLLFSGSNDYDASTKGVGFQAKVQNGMYGMNLTSVNGYSYRPGFREFYCDTSGELNTLPQNGRGTVIYGNISESYSKGTPLFLDTDGYWKKAGFYSSSQQFKVAKGLAVNNEFGECSPILVEGIFSLETIAPSIPGYALYLDDTTTGSYASFQNEGSVALENAQKLGYYLTNNLVLVNFVNSTLVQFSQSSQVEWDAVLNKPDVVIQDDIADFITLGDLPNNLVSSSEQVDYLAIINVPNGIFSNSIQVNYNLIQNTPNNLVSSSEQIAGLGYNISSSEQILIGNNLITSSEQIESFGFITESITELPDNLVSSSEQINYLAIINVPGGIVSSSNQIYNFGYNVSSSEQVLLNNNLISSSTQITNFGFISESYSTSGTGIVSSSEQIESYGFITELPDNLISSSNQVDYLAIINVPNNLVSSSQQITNYGFISESYSTSGTGIISSSNQIFDVGYNLSSSEQILLGNDLVSSSEQINYLEIINISDNILSSSTQIMNLGFNVSSSEQILIGNNLISGSEQIELLGFITESILPDSLISSSEQVDYELLQNIPSNLISSSAQITNYGFISESYSTSGTGIVSSSEQINLLGYNISSSEQILLNNDLISSSNQITNLGFITSLGVGLVSSSNQIFDLGYTISSSDQILISQSLISSSNQVDYNLLGNLPLLFDGIYTSLTGIPLGIISSSAQLSGSNVSFNQVTASVIRYGQLIPDPTV